MKVGWTLCPVCQRPTHGTRPEVRAWLIAHLGEHGEDGRRWIDAHQPPGDTCKPTIDTSPYRAAGTVKPGETKRRPGQD